MMTDDQLYDKIEAYLLGGLSKEEAGAFARQIEADPALAGQVEMHRLEHEAMEVLVERELRENLKGWIQEAKADNNVRTLRPVYRRTWFQLAAAAAVLLLIGVFVFRPEGGKVEPEGPLAQEQYQRESVLLPYQEENKTGAGLAGTADEADSTVVLLLRNSRYNNHYRFRDTLEIFYTGSRPAVAGWRLVYDAASDSYRLVTPTAVYPLNKGFNSIYELYSTESGLRK